MHGTMTPSLYTTVGLHFETKNPVPSGGENRAVSIIGQQQNKRAEPEASHSARRFYGRSSRLAQSSRNQQLT
jgi:hypothetical protein